MDEKLLYDTFSAFGVIVTNPKVLPPLIILFLRIYVYFSALLDQNTSSPNPHHILLLNDPSLKDSPLRTLFFPFSPGVQKSRTYIKSCSFGANSLPRGHGYYFLMFWFGSKKFFNACWDVIKLIDLLTWEVINLIFFLIDQIKRYKVAILHRWRNLTMYEK